MRHFTYVDHRALRLGVVIAAVAAVLQVGASGLLIVVEYPVEPTGLPFFAEWSWDAVLRWVVDRLTQGLVLVALATAAYVAMPENRHAGPVVAGFWIAAVLYGAGIVARFLLPVVLASVSVGAGVLGRLFVVSALLFGGASSVGAIAGDAIAPWFRESNPTEGENLRT